jgi:2-dehydropantoate 2-reductase
MNGMHHAILGPGGIGGLMGACLAHAGHRVTMVVRPESFATYPDHLHLESTFGTFDEPVERAVIVPPADVLWIAVKATHLQQALRSIPTPLPVPTIVPLLNGVDHVALLAERFGREHVVAATIAGESERVAAGRIRHPSPFARLNVASSGRALLEGTLDGLTKIGFICRFVDDVPTLLWSKLVFLAPLALATSAADAPVGTVRSDPDHRRQLETCVAEACAVATAEGATVSVDTTLQGVAALPAGMRSSMQKDIENGNEPELDAIAGPILRGGIAHAIPVPATSALAAAVAARGQHSRVAS